MPDREVALLLDDEAVVYGLPMLLLFHGRRYELQVSTGARRQGLILTKVRAPQEKSLRVATK